MVYDRAEEMKKHIYISSPKMQQYLNGVVMLIIKLWKG